MIQALLLGTAQDGGVPQAGCTCAHCAAAWVDPGLRRRVSALGLVDRSAGGLFMIDATPDFREQLHALQLAAPGLPLAGLLLTHAHIGHYTGLIHLGFEAMATRGLPLYGTARMLAFLRAHAPWKQLVAQGNVALIELTPGEWVPLTPALAVQPLLVPHRDEWSDTVAYVVRGPERQLLYVPDIDSWEAWLQPPYRVDVLKLVAGLDAALVDATFYAEGELLPTGRGPAGQAGRDKRAIGHPLVVETMELLREVGQKVTLIHLNHTNPVLHEGVERTAVKKRGFKVGEEGQIWQM